MIENGCGTGRGVWLGGEENFGGARYFLLGPPKSYLFNFERK